MSIKHRMYILMFAAIAGLIALAAMSIVQINRVFDAANYATVNVVPSLIALDKASTEFARSRVRLWQYAATTDASRRSKIAADMKDMTNKAVEQIKLYEKDLLADDKDKEMLKEDRNAM